MSRKPDWDVRAMNKATDEKATIGGAWNNDDGSIAIILNPFVFLESKKELLVTLFPRREKP